MKKKSKILYSLWDFITRIYTPIIDDNVAVYAAQATLFVIISSVPFISLILSIVGLILPNISVDALIQENLSVGLAEIAGSIVNDLQSAPSVSLLSISAIFTLWSASRGINAIRDGIGTVYVSKRGKNYFTHRMISLLFTLLFIVFIVFFVLIMLFGDILVSKLGTHWIVIFSRLKSPLFIVIMTLLFTGMYLFVAQRSTKVKHGIIYHIPGGVFSALGWTAFSYIYSQYIAHYPSASYIYGSLAAVCLIMLWLYFSMIILLCGAELNKLFFAGDESLSIYSKKPEETAE